MQLESNGIIIYNGRVLSENEIVSYKERYKVISVHIDIKECLDLRLKAYKLESDPLYMEWQYDQTAESEKAWRDKVAEIKERYPLPTETQPAA
ncbi:hypothetical protein SO574_23120 (plasmid) [Vibrio alfacsensis]|uniref:hypothetical protein n=1 Tax=Vibrio alfacsensis TaxID=1074311 RepID=UPI002ADD8BF1|nr:hypothetical protein [Vibrio alfacsensis]WQE79422.1 hypothetical protein SO574_23120 [Vibrio alfacsensis]